MNEPVGAIVARVRAAAEAQSTAPTATTERQRLERLASEFESMLLNQVLREMRRAGRWDEDGEDGDGFGTGALFETLDAELSKQLTGAQGFGLARQLMDAFDRAQSSVRTVAAGTPIVVDTPLPAAVPPDAETVALHAAPAAGRDVTSPFGWRRDPFTGESRFHRGVDLRAAYGEDVAVSAPGRVVVSGSQGSYGTTVVVEHENGMRTRYAHLAIALVREGDTVEPGQLVGRVGSSGRATGPHLHLEVLDRNGRPLNPLTSWDRHD